MNQSGQTRESRRSRALRLLALGLVAALTALMLSSCLGVDMNTRFNADGSGVITMKLQMSKAFLEMSNEEGSSPIPLTKKDFEEAYKDLPGVKVDSVTDQTVKDDRVITAVVSFKDFSAFKDSKDLAGAGASLTKGPDGKMTYSVIVGEPSEPAAQHGAEAAVENGSGSPTGAAPDGARANGAKGSASAAAPPGGSAGEAESSATAGDGSGTPNDETQAAVDAMMKSMMDGYSLVYSVTAPRPIISHTLGELSNGGRTVTYRIKMADYVDLKEPLTFTVVW